MPKCNHYIVIKLIFEERFYWVLWSTTFMWRQM